MLLSVDCREVEARRREHEDALALIEAKKHFDGAV
jgi:hypothetical protein